jgi:hypothetical protein
VEVEAEMVHGPHSQPQAVDLQVAEAVLVDQIQAMELLEHQILVVVVVAAEKTLLRPKLVARAGPES